MTKSGMLRAEKIGEQNFNASCSPECDWVLLRAQPARYQDGTAQLRGLGIMAYVPIKLEYKEDHLILATAADAMIRLIAAVTTDLVAEACDRHRTAPTASAALGGL